MKNYELSQFIKKHGKLGAVMFVYHQADLKQAAIAINKYLTKSDTEKTAMLNDICRMMLGRMDTAVCTSGISAFPKADQAAIYEKVQNYSDFSSDNDPYGERDFGSFTHNGEKIFWKIDCYDNSFEFGSSDPTNPEITKRVLTILLASEY